ncbi:hypothetical protein FACS189473_0470 [Spirochaetia bacterium]|nr:hypothetical protein FACS189473_0470 [Spirochaetia bacterium]
MIFYRELYMVPSGKRMSAWHQIAIQGVGVAEKPGTEGAARSEDFGAQGESRRRMQQTRKQRYYSPSKGTPPSGEFVSNHRCITLIVCPANPIPPPRTRTR